MIPFLRNVSPTGVKIFYAVLGLLLLVAGTFNFVQITFIHAASNDQCAWIRVRSNDSLLVIRSIVPGGVADEAGLMDGDTVVRINGQGFVYRTSMVVLNSLKSGDYATYTVHRGTSHLFIPVRIIKVLNISNVSFFFTGIAFLIVGLVTVLSRPKGELQQRFMNYCLANAFIFTLGVGVSIDYLHFPKPVSSTIIIVVLILIGLLLPQQIKFYFYFPFKRKAASMRWLTAVLYCISFGFVISTSFLKEIQGSNSSTDNIITSLVTGLFDVVLFSFYPAGLGILTLTYFADIPKEKRRPFRPIIVAFFMSALSFITFTITVQSVPFAIFLKPELFLPMVLFILTPLAIGYSIFRYGLMDVSIILERSLIFAIATAVLAVIYFATVSALSSVLSGYVASMFDLSPNPGDYFWVTVIAFVMLALVFDPVKRRTEDWVARIFYQERINYQKALLELSSELPGLINFQQIVETLTTRLANTMHLERVAILLNDQRFSDLGTLSESRNDDFLPEGPERETLFEELQTVKRPVYVEQHSEIHNNRESDENILARRGIVLAVPLMVKDNLIGVITVGKKRSGKGFSNDDVDLLMTVASQAAIAFENARLYESEIQKQKMEDSLSIARRIQQSLLPQHSPVIKGLDVFGSSLTAEIVGGDFYDLIELSPTKLLVVVGDVSGKGISAALYMSKIQGMMQLASNRYESPRDMIIHINRYIYGSMERNSFVTMVLALFDMEERTVKICRAGHTKPLLSQSGDISFINSRGLGIGLCSNELFDRHLEEMVIPLNGDSTFVFFSDGLNEAINEHKEQFGTEVMQNVVKVFKSFPSRTVHTNIEQAVDTFRGQTELYDDLTLVVVKTIRD